MKTPSQPPGAVSCSTERRTPIVSVILPAYNAKDTIDRAIDSVLEQTFTDFELIVVDDGSTDGTSEHVGRIADSRVRLLSNVVNAGVSIARNQGIQNAAGDWIAFLDADDTWRPNRLALLLEAAHKYRVDVVFDDSLFLHPPSWNASGTMLHLLTGAPQRFEGPVSPAAFLSNSLSALREFVRRRFLMDSGVAFRPGLTNGEDQLFRIELLLAGATVAVLPLPLYEYRLPEELRNRPTDAFVAELRRLLRLEQNPGELRRHLRTLVLRLEGQAFLRECLSAWRRGGWYPLSSRPAATAIVLGASRLLGYWWRLRVRPLLPRLRFRS